MTGISFHEMAEMELNEAARYYESEVEGLGKAFLNEVEHAIEQIKEHAEAAPVILQVVRRKLIRRFPYIGVTANERVLMPEEQYEIYYPNTPLRILQFNASLLRQRNAQCGESLWSERNCRQIGEDPEGQGDENLQPHQPLG